MDEAVRGAGEANLLRSGDAGLEVLRAALDSAGEAEPSLSGVSGRGAASGIGISESWGSWCCGAWDSMVPGTASGATMAALRRALSSAGLTHGQRQCQRRRGRGALSLSLSLSLSCRVAVAVTRREVAAADVEHETGGGRGARQWARGREAGSRGRRQAAGICVCCRYMCVCG